MSVGLVGRRRALRPFLAASALLLLCASPVFAENPRRPSSQVRLEASALAEPVRAWPKAALLALVALVVLWRREAIVRPRAEGQELDVSSSSTGEKPAASHDAST